jgi:hypothetical protein
VPLADGNTPRGTEKQRLRFCVLCASAANSAIPTYNALVFNPEQEGTINRREVKGAESMDLNQLSHRAIGACMEVHRHLGPGLLESTYEECLCYELRLQGIEFKRQKSLPVFYLT